MSLSRAQNIFKPANINSIVLLHYMIFVFLRLWPDNVNWNSCILAYYNVLIDYCKGFGIRAQFSLCTSFLIISLGTCVAFDFMVKPGSHIIADDRRRSQVIARSLKPFKRRRRIACLHMIAADRSNQWQPSPRFTIQLDMHRKPFEIYKFSWNGDGVSARSRWNILSAL